MKLPESELRALGLIVPGTRILEYGNKKNSSGLYRDYYETQGARYWCTDINGEDGAIAWDWTKPPPLELEKLAPFDVVTNFGCSEHVAEGQVEFWENIHNMVHPKFGQLASVLPMPGKWRNHGKAKGYPGTWYPTPFWFASFADLNGYEVSDLWIDHAKGLVCCRMCRVDTRPFNMPYLGMYNNITNEPPLESLKWDY